ncbi:MAG: S49 family peptidase, partial [Candidatus Aminicenantales bacterium]
ETEKEVFQEIVNAYYQKFLDVVAEARKGHLSREEVAKVADGRIFTATQALSLKLIDDVGYFDNALEKILDLAQVPEAKVIAYTYYPKSRTNIYATSLRGASLIEEEGLANLVRSLKSGFYYLWHPQLYD